MVEYAADVNKCMQKQTAKGVTGDPTAGDDFWNSGVKGTDGMIYAIPRNPVSAAQALLVIDTKSVGSFCSPLLQSAYFNKY